MYRYSLLILLILIFYSCQMDNNKVVQDNDKDLASNNIRNYLIDVAGGITDKALKDIHSATDWEEIRDQRLEEFRSMVSLVSMAVEGDRPPLNVKYTGTIQKEGYRIEKLYYESLPGLYVPANLYIPDNITEPVPGVLYLCGHSRTQKVHYQAHPRKFAELGFVCLIVETIQYGEVWGEHWGCYARGWFNWYSRGYTPAGVEVWNGMRGLDLMSELPEVNAEKLGITGISGGGAISWFLAAADPRIAVVAPVCGNSTLETQVSTRTLDGHCDCMMMINTYGRDFQDIGALIAPRPLFIAQADRDGLNTIESSYRVYQELRDFYRLFGAEDNIDFIATPGGHSYHKNSRQEIFSFFMKHLMGREVSPDEAGDVDESPRAMLDEETLQVYHEGVPEDDRTKVIQDSFIELLSPPEIRSNEELRNYKDYVTAQLKEKTFHNFPAEKIPFDSVMEFRTQDRAPYGSNVYSFMSEKGWRLKVDFRWIYPVEEKKPLMIVLRSPGEERYESEDFISGLKEIYGVEEYDNIAYFETRGVGENGWTPELQWHVRRASAWTGRTVASMRVYDVLRCIEFCRTLENVDGSKIGIAARDEMVIPALYAALLDGECYTVIVKDPPSTLDMVSQTNGRGASIELLNALQIADVNQIPAFLSPTFVLFIDKLPEAYDWSAKTLTDFGTNLVGILIAEHTVTDP